MGHCLQLDIISQGDSIEHAFEMVCEACELAMNADYADGLDPFDREPAPDEDWEPYYKIMKRPVPLSRVPVERRHRVKAVAGEIVVIISEVEKSNALSLEEGWSPMADEASRDSCSAHAPH